MTPTPVPAHFIHDPKTGRYLPANKVATTLAAQLSKMTLSHDDLRAVKARGFRCTFTNGEPIDTGVSA